MLLVQNRNQIFERVFVADEDSAQSFTAAGLPRARVWSDTRPPEDSHRKDPRCSSREGRRPHRALAAEAQSHDSITRSSE